MPAPVLLYTLQLTAISSAILIALGYLKAVPGRVSGRIFALGVCFVALYIVEGMTGAHVDSMFRIDLSYWWRLTHPAVQSIPGLFMVYSFLEFQERPRFPLLLAVLFSVQVLFEVILAMVGEGIAGNALDRIGLGLNILQMIFVGFALYWTLKGWRTDLVEDRRILRWIGISMQGVILFLVLLVENFLVGFGVIGAAQAQMVIVSAIVLLLSFLLLSSIKLDYVALGNSIRKVSVLTDESATQSSEELSAASFDQQFREGRLYREAGLTIASLARQFNVPEYRLRQFIHKTLGFRNFNAMLHQYRIDDAQEMLVDPHNSDVPILTIALTVGYRSSTPFNNAFRDIKGVTPSEFRRKKLRD